MIRLANFYRQEFGKDPAGANDNGPIRTTDIGALATDEGTDRTERLIQGAKREGELMLYGSMQLESLALLQKGFETKYGVKVRLWRGAGGDILQRMTIEAKANRFGADVIESDGFALEALHREKLLQLARSPFAPDLVPT